MSNPRSPHVEAVRTRVLRKPLTLVLGALAGVALSGLALAAPAHAAIAFPFSTDFATADGGTLTGSAGISDGWLRLTDTGADEAGSWTTNDSFPADLGLVTTFSYATYGGSGADGFSFFLADAAAPQGVGAPGGALGYSCSAARSGGTGPCNVPGVPGGFVGIGFDEYGNYSQPLSNSGPGRTPDTIAVRGSGDGTTGYRYLAGVPAPSGAIATGSRAGERTAQVIVLPTPGGGLTLSVRSDTGPGTPLQPVITDLPLTGSGQAPLPAALRLGFAGGTGGRTNVHEIDSLAVNVPTDLAITKTGPAQVAAGQDVDYTVQASNHGVNDAAGSVVDDVVPAAVHDVTWTCASTAVALCVDPSGSGNTIQARADLPVGGVATYTVHGTVDPAATGSIVNTATVTPPADRTDDDLDDNAATATTTISSLADVQLTKQPPAAAPRAGESTSWTLTAANAGPSAAAGVAITDTLPADLTFVSSDPAECTATGAVVTCPVGTLAPGQTSSVHLLLRVADDTPAGTTIRNTATVTSTTSDPDLTNNTGEATSAAVVADEPAPVTEEPAPTDGADTTHPQTLAFTGSAVPPAAGGIAVGAVVLGLVLSIAARRRERRTARREP